MDMPSVVRLRIWRDEIYRRDTLLCGNGRKVADYRVDVYEDISSPVVSVLVAVPPVEHIKMLLEASEPLPGSNDGKYVGSDPVVEGADLSSFSQPVGGSGVTSSADNLTDTGEGGE